MSLIFIVGYSLALLVGCTLGLVGAGGAILTTPILVYLFDVSPSVAAGYSMLVVGGTSAIATIQNIREKQLDILKGIWIFLPTVAGSLLMRRFLSPYIPQTLSFIGISFTKDTLIMVLLASAMFFAGATMLFPAKKLPSGQQQTPKILLFSFLIGIFTGFVGIGGGFFYLPLLIMAAGMTPRIAVGTSLFVIALNSLLNFGSDMLSQSYVIDYAFILLFTGITIGGMFLGLWLSQRLSAETLKRAFGALVIFVAVVVLLLEGS